MQPGLNELAHRSCLLGVKSVAPRQDMAHARSAKTKMPACMYILMWTQRMK